VRRGEPGIECDRPLEIRDEIVAAEQRRKRAGNRGVLRDVRPARERGGIGRARAVGIGERLISL
jgi:hypothetical protein